MSDSGAQLAGFPATVPAEPDGAARLIAADLELLDLLELAHRRDNPSTRFYVNKARNDRNRYRKLIDWAKADRKATFAAWHRITHGQLAAAVYGVEPGADEGHKKAASNRRSLDRLQAAGVIEWRPETTGTGKFVCLAFRLCPVPALPSSAPAGVAQSVQATGRSRLGWTRKRESPAERRRECPAPRVRRTGHGSSSPFGKAPGSRPAPPGSLFSGGDLIRPGSEGGRNPVGGPSPSSDSGGCERAGATRRPVGGGVDAIERACPPNDRAALGRLRSLAPGEGASERLSAIRQASAGSPIVAVALAAWEAATGREPRLSIRSASQLQRSAEQLDRLQGDGRAADVVLGYLESLGPGGWDHHDDARIESLAFVVAIVKQLGREARRYDRHARGLRPSPRPRPHRPRGGV